jgi:membrane fusion protein (multidrug efflux system)
VKLGATRGDLVAIESGVKPGEQIVSAGVFKLRNGAAVQVNNTVQPSADAAPKPANT